MSLYLIELKIKTALELGKNVQQYLDQVPAGTWVHPKIQAAVQDLIRQLGVLREIINRPKEEGNNG